MDDINRVNCNLESWIKNPNGLCTVLIKKAIFKNIHRGKRASIMFSAIKIVTCTTVFI